MPNTLALIGDSIKSTATAIVPRLSFGANQSRGAITYGGFMGNALIQTANFGAPGAAQADYDYGALLTDPMQNSVVAACVDVITRAIAEAPLILETKKGAEWVKVESHPALDLFRANSHLSDSEIWGVTAAHKATRGLGYWVVFYNEAKTKPVELWPWAPEKVRAVSDSKEFIGEYEVQDEAGEWKTLLAKQVIQFRHLPNLRDLRGGWCPLSSGQVQMVGDNAVSTYNTAILLNAGVMSLLISIKAGEAQGRSIEVTPGQFQEWIDRLRRKHIGNKASAGGIEGTTLPLEVTKMAFSPDEMSVEKLEGIFMTRLHALLGVSPKLTGMGPDATYLNQAEAINDFWERRIVPERNKDADTLNRQLLPLLDLDGDKWRFRFDFSNVAALQENTDGLFTRWRGLFKDGGCDLYTLQTKLGFTDVPDSFKGRFAGGGGGDAAAPDEAEVKRFDPTQSRDDGGKWTSGGAAAAGGKGAKASRDLKPGTIEEALSIGVAIPKGSTSIEIAIDPKSDVLAKYTQTSGKPRTVYHADWDARQAEAKYSRIVDLHADIANLQGQIDAEINAGGDKAHQALTLRLILKTGLRNGGKSGGGKVEAFGASSLLTSHTKTEGDRVSLDFIGKEGVRQRHVFHDADIAAHIRARKNGGHENVFDGDATKTLKYLGALTGDKYKVHDLRTFYGTALAADRVEKITQKEGAPQTAKELKALKNRVGLTVGAHLGNDAKMSLTNYIAPQVFGEWEQGIKSPI